MSDTAVEFCFRLFAAAVLFALIELASAIVPFAIDWWWAALIALAVVFLGELIFLDD